MEATLYRLVLYFATALSLYISYQSWKRRPSNCATAVSLLMLSVSLWTMSEALYLFSKSFPLKMFWYNFRFFSITVVPVLWLIVALQYTKFNKMVSKLSLSLLLIIPAITVVMVWTDPWHHLFRTDVKLVDNGFLLIIANKNQIWFWVHTYYSYLLLFTGIALLSSAFFKLPGIYRKQTAILLAGALVPWVGNAITIYKLVPLPDIDITPLTMPLTGAVFFFGLFRYRFLDLIPIARDMLVENMQDIIMVIDTHKRIIDLNPTARTILNETSGTLIGQPITTVLAPWTDYVEKFIHVLKAEEKVTIEKDGNAKYYDFRLSPIYDRKGTFKGQIIVLRDITSLEEALIELEKSHEEAEAANKAKSQFLATMSHEIRTPMNAIIGASELMQETELTGKQKELADVIKTSANSLLTIINDILDFSKIEAGKLDLKPVTFHLESMISEIVAMFEGACEKKGIAIVSHADEYLPPHITGDPVRIKQVLVNILGNAVKFTEKGAVSLHSRSETSSDGHPLICFSITDTGVGIPEAQLSTLFRPFHQLDNSFTRKFDGTGLGLAIVKKLTDMMNGTIEVKSKEGAGSTFIVKIPYKAAEGPAAEAAASLQTAPSSSASPSIHPDSRILVVEDNKTNQMLVKMMLQKLGITADLADNGLIALECMEGTSYDLVLMDIHMPQMDGYEAVKAIRNREIHSGLHVPVIALTANAMSGDREKCLDAGMDDFLPKPIRPVDLYEVLERHMKKAG